jgi:hypothetical protein
MENHVILKRRRWSPVRKAQVITAVLGFIVTSALLIFDALQIEIPRDSPFGFLFGVGLLLFLPADRLANALGIAETLGYWGWRILAISVNTGLAYALGTFLGGLILILKRALNRRNQ